MKLCGLQLGNVSSFEVKPETFDNFGQGDLFKQECQLVQDEDTNRIYFKIKNAVWEIVGSHPKDQYSLGDILSRSLPQLCWISGVYPKDAPHQTLTIQVHEFSDYRVWFDSLDVGIDEKIVEDIHRRYLPSHASKQEILGWLNTEMIIPPGMEGSETSRIIVSSSPKRLEFDDAFRLYGENIAIDVRIKKNKYHITRIVPVNSIGTYGERFPLILIEGNIQFKDMTIAGERASSIQIELKHLIQQSDSYFKLWSEYNDLEEDNIREKAIRFGVTGYTECHPLGDGSWQFTIQDSEQWQRLVDHVGETPSLEAREDEDVPEYLRSGVETVSLLTSPARYYSKKYFIGRFINFHHYAQTIDLKPQNSDDEIIHPPEQGILAFSLFGDKTRLERRRNALEKIKSGESPMPQLGLLLEKKPFAFARQRKIRPKPQLVKKLFHGNPNTKQREAIKIALNTPDIALIIGPPGTGKTQIISAICEILAEDAKQSHIPISKNILLTAFQHVAVEHTSARTKVYELPTIKIGKKFGQEDGHDPIKYWIDKKVEELDLELVETPLRTRLKHIRRLYISYLQSPIERNETADLLQELLDSSQQDISGNLRDAILSKKQSLQRCEITENIDEARILALRAVRGLRTNEIAFSDDGPRSAQKLLKRVEKFQWLLTEEEQELLEYTVNTLSPSQGLFEKLQHLQNRLIDALQATEPHLLPPALDHGVQQLFVHAIDEMIRKEKESQSGVEAVISELCEDLKKDPIGVRKTLEEYQVVLASTVQQADSKQISTLKDDTGSQYFNTIIVEEAARANPLDLLIPMAKAERRIILVGDHRQLPHLLETSVEEAIQSSNDGELKDAYQESLFARLVEYFRERKKNDHIPRVVMLDTQYRMHPFLGKFISKTFYESQGDTPIRSVKSEAFFEHGLSKYQGKVVVWMDEAISKGEERRGKSKARSVEAKRIAEEVREIVEENPELSIGIISFYAAQVTELWRAFYHKKMAIFDDEIGDYVFDKRWQTTEKEQQEHIYIGTVDACQGKEFDVVFLSMTRSNRLSLTEDEKSWKRKFGFLCLENRLNVAMSRARKLLFVAGDQNMFLSNNGLPASLAQQAVPGLFAFWKATGNEGIAEPAQNEGNQYGIRI